MGPFSVSQSTLGMLPDRLARHSAQSCTGSLRRRSQLLWGPRVPQVIEAAGAVVGHVARDLHAQAAVVSDGLLEEGDGALLFLIPPDLGEGQARAIFDGHVDELAAPRLSPFWRSCVMRRPGLTNLRAS